MVAYLGCSHILLLCTTASPAALPPQRLKTLVWPSAQPKRRSPKVRDGEKELPGRKIPDRTASAAPGGESDASDAGCGWGGPSGASLQGVTGHAKEVSGAGDGDALKNPRVSERRQRDGRESFVQGEDKRREVWRNRCACCCRELCSCGAAVTTTTTTTVVGRRNQNPHQ